MVTQRTRPNSATINKRGKQRQSNAFGRRGCRTRRTRWAEYPLCVVPTVNASKECHKSQVNATRQRTIRSLRITAQISIADTPIINKLMVERSSPPVHREQTPYACPPSSPPSHRGQAPFPLRLGSTGNIIDSGTGSSGTIDVSHQHGQRPSPHRINKAL